MQLTTIVILAALAAGGWLWLDRDGPADSKPGAGKAPAATLVLVEPLSLAEDKVVVRAVGTGEALTSAALHPAVDGEVVEILFQAGQRVTKGEALLRLDDKHQRLAVRLVEVALANATRELERQRKLAAKGAAAQIRLDSAETEMEATRVRLAQARAELADRTVKAPFDGVVGLTDVDVGDRVTDETQIATLDDRSALLVDFNLPEDYAARIALGDPVLVRPWSQPEREIEGGIVATGSRIDPSSRVLRVRARIPNPDERLRPGTSFQVELAFTGRRYPVVREVAVLWSRDGAYLWRAVDGRAEKVFVQLVRRDRGRLLVDGPLNAGDLIVVEGVQGLRVGQALEASPFDADKAAGLQAPARRPGRKSRS